MVTPSNSSWRGRVVMDGVLVIATLAALLVPAATTQAVAGPAAPVALPRAGGSYVWPVVGPVIHGFEPPPGPYGAGHRGIDIDAPFGTDMVAAQEGIVAFAGWVGGSLFISIDHPDGVRSTYSWLSAVVVARNDTVAQGQLIGKTGHGHPEVATPHLHFGTRVGTTYVDPMRYLEPGSVAGLIHLAPLVGGWTSPWGTDARWPGPSPVGPP